MKLKDLILNNIFKLSNQPVLLKDLLEANALYNEGIMISADKLHYKVNIFAAYVIYAIICLIVLMPCVLATHHLFTMLNFHISIIVTIVINSALFIGYDFFKQYLTKIITKKLIMRAWLTHFPYFSYEKYNKAVEQIYTKAIKDNISKNLLEKYVIDELLKYKF